MKKKEEVTITFYAAECGEFHDLGEYTKCRTLEEAYKKYQKYCRTSANMCPAIEFSIHDPESIYSDMEYPLPLSSKDRGDLELVPYYNEHPLVNEAIRQLEQLPQLSPYSPPLPVFSPKYRSRNARRQSVVVQ